MYYKLKHKTTGKYLAGEMNESILMMIDEKDRKDVIILHELDIEDLYDESFIDELTLDEVEFCDLEKEKV